MASHPFPPVLEIRRHAPEQPEKHWTYRMLDARQREVARSLREDPDARGALLVSEVAPVITLGRRTGPGELLMNEGALRERGVDVVPVDRGGLATWHGPGQWVLFAVDRLERLTGDPRGVKAAVQGLLELALKVARVYEPRVEIREGAELGVWTPRGKLAAVGVHVEQGILLHGLSFNVFRSELSFQGLRPCGLDAPVDFVSPRPDDGVFRALGDRLSQAAMDRFWS